jgi:hypothetical protein
MSENRTFGTQIIGQTERALGALLDRQLAGTGLTAPQWVTLTLAAASGGTVRDDRLRSRVAAALKVSATQAQARISELTAAELLSTPPGEAATVTVTAPGLQLCDQIRAGISEITRRLWGDLPPEDLETAGRVLGTVLDRANEELSRA